MLNVRVFRWQITLLLSNVQQHRLTLLFINCQSSYWLPLTSAYYKKNSASETLIKIKKPRKRCVSLIISPRIDDVVYIFVYGLVYKIILMPIKRVVIWENLKEALVQKCIRQTKERFVVINWISQTQLMSLLSRFSTVLWK